MADGDVLQIVAGHQAFAPGGVGGGVTVTDGTTTVDPTTSFTFPSGTLASPGGGVADISGVLQVSLLGPFHVTVDSVGLDETGGSPTALSADGFVPLVELPDGVIVVLAWAQPTVTFDVGTAKLVVDIQPTDDPDNSSDISGGWSTQVGGGAPAFAAANRGPGSQIVARALSGAQLMVYLTSDTPCTVGEADIFAIIATPAS